MVDHSFHSKEAVIAHITPELRTTLNETKKKLRGSDRRRFMAQITLQLGPNGQARAERELGWNRVTIRKAIKELQSGICCLDNFSARGRRLSEHHLPGLLKDIKDIVEPVSQVDPTFRTDNHYSPLTAKQVRQRLIEEKHYHDEQLPKERTIRSKLNDLGFKPQKVAKAKPLKK